MIREQDFFIVRKAVVKFSPEKAEEFYTEHKGKFFYNRLVEFMCIHPAECMILAHPNAIQHWRTLMGPTKPYTAQIRAPYTIRGTYGLTDTRNSTHGSDSESSAQREAKIIFPNFNLKEWYQNEEHYFQSAMVTFCAEEQVHKPV